MHYRWYMSNIEHFHPAVVVGFIVLFQAGHRGWCSIEVCIEWTCLPVVWHLFPSSAVVWETVLHLLLPTCLLLLAVLSPGIKCKSEGDAVGAQVWNIPLGHLEACLRSAVSTSSPLATSKAPWDLMGIRWEGEDERDRKSQDSPSHS